MLKNWHEQAAIAHEKYLKKRVAAFKIDAAELQETLQKVIEVREPMIPAHEYECEHCYCDFPDYECDG